MRFAWLACLAWLLAGCGSPGGDDAPPAGTADTRPEAAPQSTAEAPARRTADSPAPEGTPRRTAETAAPEGTLRRTAETSTPEPTPRRAEFSSAAGVKPVEEYLEEPRFAAADFGRGEVLSYACRACHALDEEEENALGPNLDGVFGRRAATRPGFEYSAALRESGIVWTPDALDAWLKEPAGFIPGNNMAFTGFRSAEDRRDLIAYLLRHMSRDE